jgi:NAD(P)-dependent dehydrogenase (short-subunit alcohol dehydrogenase family)
MIGRLEGLVGIVTGAGNGIGRAIAVGLAARGMRLALVDLDRTGLATTIELTGNPAAHRPLSSTSATRPRWRRPGARWPPLWAARIS